MYFITQKNVLGIEISSEVISPDEYKIKEKKRALTASTVEELGSCIRVCACVLTFFEKGSCTLSIFICFFQYISR